MDHMIQVMCFLNIKACKHILVETQHLYAAENVHIMSPLILIIHHHDIN